MLFVDLTNYCLYQFQILDVLYATADGFEVPEEVAVDADEPDEYWTISHFSFPQSLSNI